MRGRLSAALVTGALVATIGSGVALALPVAAASRVAAPSRAPAEPLSPKMRLASDLTTRRATPTTATPQLASSAPCNSNWNAVASPNVGAGRNNLNGIAAVAPNDVWSVGTYVNGSSVFQTLAEHWDGSAWSVVTTPNVGTGNNLFIAVTAIGPADVWAVGYWRTGDSSTGAQPLTEHWNGNGWTIVPTPLAPNSSTKLSSVSADASNDVWAVGIWIDVPTTNLGPRARPYVLRWTGSNWSAVVAPVPQVPTGGLDFSGLNGVKVLTGNDVWVVGDGADFTGNFQVSADTAFSNHWNGAFWSSVSVPAHSNGDFLSDVQGSAGDLWAVGGQSQSYQGVSDNVLIEHSTGTNWIEVTTPALASQSANLFALGYITGTNVYAVGATASNPATAQELDQTLIERWNGSAWSQVSSANPSMSDGLFAIAAISGSAIWTAGFTTGNGYEQTLTENYCVPPVVTNVAPSSGNGGSTVVITGSGFSRAIDVEFGATPAFSFHVDSDTQITAVSPGHKAGTVHITVTVQGTSATSSADQFTYTGSRSGVTAEPDTHFQGRTFAPPPVPPPPPTPMIALRRFAGTSRSAPTPI